jgi:hypothetical protein
LYTFGQSDNFQVAATFVSSARLSVARSDFDAAAGSGVPKQVPMAVARDGLRGGTVPYDAAQFSIAYIGKDTRRRCSAFSITTMTIQTKKRYGVFFLRT